MKMVLRNQGFTLVELMVTIAILAILATMAAPSFQDALERRRLDSSTRELALVLAEARSQAAVLRKTITIKFQSGINASTIYYWMPKYSTVTLNNKADDVDFSDIEFTPVGVPKQRTKTIKNPNYVSTQPTNLSVDPPVNPPTIEVLIPLKFELCNISINESKTIQVSLNGTVERISTGTCSS